MDLIAMENRYLELRRKADDIHEEMERARLEALPQIIADIRKQLEEYKIAPEDIYPSLRVAQSTSSQRRAKRDRPARYMSPLGETWSGGPGRKPKWVCEIEDAGESLEKYRINP